MVFLQTNAAGVSYAGALLQSLLALLAVCALAVVALRLLARARGVGFTGRGERLVRVVERTALDPKRALYVVDAGAERLLLGVGEEGAPTLLRVLPRSTWHEAPALDSASEPADATASPERRPSERGGSTRAPGEPVRVGFAAALSAIRRSPADPPEREPELEPTRRPTRG